VFKVELIETTPLPGLDLTLDQIPAPVQTALGAEIEASGALDLPRHMFKAYGDVQISSKIAVDLDLIAASGSIARGNENDAHQPDGVFYLGPRFTPAYGIVNIGVLRPHAMASADRAGQVHLRHAQTTYWIGTRVKF
jgi:hypothetical protein